MLCDHLCGKCRFVVLIQIIFLLGTAQAYFPLDYDRISVTASSEYGPGQSPQRLIDSSGLRTDLHDNHQFGSTMWLSNPNPSLSRANALTQVGPAWIAFEFDKPYQLSSLWIWNYNQSSVGWLGWSRGLKNVTIEYSADGQTWHKLGDFTVAPAAGFYGYAHNTEINLAGITAKHLVITAHTTEGCYHDGSIGYGLSEVRFFGLITQASQPNPINNSRGIDPNVTLSWLPGELVATTNGHAIYFGDDLSAVTNADSNDRSGIFKGFRTTPTYTPGPLEDGRTY